MIERSRCSSRSKSKIHPDGSLQGFLRDITDRKQAERARARVRELEQRHTGRLAT